MICRARVKQSVCGSETMAQRWTLMFWTRLHEAPLRERRSFVQLYAAIGLRKSRTSSGHRHTVRLRLRGSRQSLCSTSQPLRTWKSADPPIAAQMRGIASRKNSYIIFHGHSARSTTLERRVVYEPSFHRIHRQVLRRFAEYHPTMGISRHHPKIRPNIRRPSQIRPA